MWRYVRLGEDAVIDRVIVVDVVGVNRGGGGEHGATGGPHDSIFHMGCVGK